MSEPVGAELSINVKEVPELDGLSTGSKCKICIEGTKLGQHTHVAGKKETMADIRIDKIYYDEDEE